MRIIFFVLLSTLINVNISSQYSPLTLEKIWASSELVYDYVPGFNFLNKGGQYTRMEEGVIKQYDIASGDYIKDVLSLNAIDSKKLKLGVEGYTFSQDEKFVLIYTNSHQIYRHSFYAKYYVFNLEEESLGSVSEDLIRSAHLSPNGRYVAFVKDNNLFYKDLASHVTKQITHDGQNNKIINGVTDWVYEEEFSFVRAFEWSPDNKHLVYIRFDESEVPEYTMAYYDDQLYPNYYTFKYPKVGENNSLVSVHSYNLEDHKKIEINWDKPTDDYYIPRIKWSKDPSKVSITILDREQKHLQLLLGDVRSGKTNVILREENPYYIDITDDLYFFEDGDHFLWPSEKDGFNHIYLHSISSHETKQLTMGQYDITKIYGVSSDEKTVFFQSADVRAENRSVRELDIETMEITELHIEDGWSDAEFSSDFSYRVVTQSTINQAPTYKVYNENNKLARVIEENYAFKIKQEENFAQPFEFFDFTTSENVTLNGWMLKPSAMNDEDQYPVLMYTYGGPNSQEVVNQFSSKYYWWFQFLTQKGYVVACIDNRGTGARGQVFRKMTQHELGKYETMDQIEGAKYLGSLDYIDSARVGIFGWSYGGYLSSLCILKGGDVFKSALAIAPVTNWKWYDTVYTERYMGTEKNNASGYRNNSPVYFADQLKGNYFLAHGTGDDNVHFQHTIEMADALISHNKDFDICFYPNKNHGIYGGYTRLHLFRKMTSFILEKI